MKKLKLKLLLGAAIITLSPIVTATSAYAAETVKVSETETVDNNNEENDDTKESEESESLVSDKKEDVVNKKESKYDFSEYTLDDFGIDYEITEEEYQTIIDEYLYEEYGKGEFGEGLTYEIDLENNQLILDGEGEFPSEYQSIADLPWVVYYDDIDGIHIAGNVKIKLWQASKKSAEMSNHLGNYKEVVEEIKDEAKDEALKDSDFYKELFEKFVEQRTLFNDVLEALELTEEEFLATYNMDINDFLSLYEDDMEELCKILGCDSIEALLKGEKTEKAELVSEETVLAYIESLGLTEEEFFEIVGMEKEKFLEMTVEEFEEFIEDFSVIKFVTEEEVNEFIIEMDMTEEEFFNKCDKTMEDFLRMTIDEFESFKENFKLANNNSASDVNSDVAEPFNYAAFLESIGMSSEEFTSKTGYTEAQVAAMSDEEREALSNSLMEENEQTKPEEDNKPIDNENNDDNSNNTEDSIENNEPVTNEDEFIDPENETKTVDADETVATDEPATISSEENMDAE